MEAGSSACTFGLESSESANALSFCGFEMAPTHNHYIPGKFILFDINQGVFNGFVHECVHTGDEKVDGAQQCLSVFGQKLLGLSVVTKLLLKNRVKQVLGNDAIICFYLHVQT